MDERGEGCSQDQFASGFEQAHEFIQRVCGFGHMLEHLAAEDGIETRIGRRDGGDVADEIDTAGVPALALQALIDCPAAGLHIGRSPARHTPDARSAGGS